MRLSPEQIAGAHAALCEICPAADERSFIRYMDGPHAGLKVANQKLLPALLKHRALFDEIAPIVIEAVTEEARAALERFEARPEILAELVSKLGVVASLNRAQGQVATSIQAGMVEAPIAALCMMELFQWAVDLSSAPGAARKY